jgi:hypothetical protein
MERYKKEVPQKISKDLHVDGDNIVLMPQSTGAFIAMNGGLPVHDKDGDTIQFTKEDFSKWVDTSMKADLYEKITAIHYEAYRTRIQGELKKLQNKDSYVLDHFDPHAGGHLFNDRILGRQAYDRLVKHGLHTRPLSELLTTMK